MSTKTDLARAARTLRAASARRDTLVRRLRDEGWSLRAIAPVAQLSHQAVKLICDAGPGEVGE